MDISPLKPPQYFKIFCGIAGLDDTKINSSWLDINKTALEKFFQEKILKNSDLTDDQLNQIDLMFDDLSSPESNWPAKLTSILDSNPATKDLFNHLEDYIFIELANFYDRLSKNMTFEQRQVARSFQTQNGQ